MKKIHLIPNIITAFGLACGLFVIFKISMIDTTINFFEVMILCIFILLIAAFADFVDGAIARMFHSESQFGLMFDSLADSVTFGIAPSILMIKSLSCVLKPGSLLSFAVASSVMIYSLCGILRLVRFNVIAINTPKSRKKNKYFEGLPIPAAAFAAISTNLFFFIPFVKNYLSISHRGIAYVLSIVMVILGYLMVSKFKFLSLKFLKYNKEMSFPIIFIFAIVVISFLYSIIYYFPIVLFIISWIYILGSFIGSVFRTMPSKKRK